MEQDFGSNAIPPLSELADLLLRWVLSCTKDFAEVMAALTAKRPLPLHSIPDSLLPTITAVEPYRTQATAQAGQWLNTLWPILFGPEILLPDNLPMVPFARWQHTISPVSFKVWWTRDMAGHENEVASGVIHRAAVENGQWRIVYFVPPLAEADDL